MYLSPDLRRRKRSFVLYNGGLEHLGVRYSSRRGRKKEGFIFSVAHLVVVMIG
jgi:hypothetical protein